MKSLTLSTCLALFATVQAVAAEQPALTPAMLEVAIGEDWTGELEYLNYGREDRSIIPVRMVARAPTRHTMAYAFLLSSPG